MLAPLGRDFVLLAQAEAPSRSKIASASPNFAKSNAPMPASPSTTKASGPDGTPSRNRSTASNSAS
jgi:hypothetical protein